MIARKPATFTLDRARYIVGAVLVASVTALAGCASHTSPLETANAVPGSRLSTFPGFGATDLSPRRNGNQQAYGDATSKQGETSAEIYTGSVTDSAIKTGADITQTSAPLSTGQGAVKEGDDYQLNFENAEVAAVVKTIVGDVLQQNYTIDPRVTGQINLASARPVPKASLMRTLEAALKSVNASVVKDGQLIRVVQQTESVGAGPLEFGSASEGFGTTVIVVKYVAVDVVARLLDNFVTRPNAIRSDPTLNLIIVQGTAQERRAAMDAVSALDIDVMRTQSVGIFQLMNSSPDAVISELNKILDTGESGVGHNQVKLQQMTRMNAVLVVARQKSALQTVSEWIRRLDRSDQSAVGIKVYRLKFAKAKNVADMLNDVLSGRSSSSQTPGGLSKGESDTPQTSGSSSGNFIQSPATSLNSTPTKNGSSPNAASPTSLASANWVGQNGQSVSMSGNGAGDPSSSSAQGGAQNSSPKVRVTPDVANNALLIVAGPSDYKIVEAAIRQLDRPPVQVAIEATIAEITLTDQLQYGVQAYLQSTDISKSSHQVAAIGLTQAAASAAISAVVPGANLILGPASSPRVVLNALHAVTGVKVLSSPSMVVLDNQPATLQVGNEVAIKTQSSQSTESSTAPVIDSITYKDTGIILNVQPHVNANGIVNLDVEQEISSIVDNSGGSDGLTPTISQRRVKSSIVVSSGQTVLLAGMISEQSNQSKSGLPGMLSWKWLGDVLSNTNNTSTRSELIIFIKPRIMRDGADAQAVSQEFRDRMTSMMGGESTTVRAKY